MTRNRRIAVFVVVLLALAAGGVVAGIILTEGSSSGSGTVSYAYPKSARDAFLSACRTRSSGGYCACQLQALQNTVPYPAYQTILSGGVGATLRTQALWQAYLARSADCH